MDLALVPWPVSLYSPRAVCYQDYTKHDDANRREDDTNTTQTFIAPLGAIV